MSLGALVAEELEGCPPRCDLALLEAVAEHVHEERIDDSAVGLAGGQGVEVAIEPGLPVEVDGLALKSMSLLLVRPAISRSLLSLRIVHELAHLLLDRLGWAHNHGDVWFLTLAIAVPRSMLRAQRASNVLDLAAFAGTEGWVAAMRMRMAQCSAA
ncbi:MAG: hypothetical protein JNK72_00235 [Myxococcales bacterium]|nr:hypothetical protein [Myxococcales bacterium]